MTLKRAASADSKTRSRSAGRVASNYRFNGLTQEKLEVGDRLFQDAK